MDKQTFEAELARVAARRGAPAGLDRLDRDRENGRASASDYADSLADYLAARLRGRVAETDHPLARYSMRDGVSLRGVVERAHGIDLREPGALQRMITVSDLPWILSTAGTAVVEDLAGAAEHRPLCARLEVPDLKDQTLGRLDLGELEASVTVSGATPVRERPVAALDDSATAAANLYTMGILIARSVLVNDSIGLIGAAIRAAAQALLRREARTFGELLSANPNAPDGSPLIGVSNTTSGAPSVTTLNAAEGILRNMTNAAAATGNSAGRFLLVPPTDYASARVLSESMGGWPEVVTSAWFPSGYAYLLADPLTSPTFARLVLGGRDLPRVFPRRAPLHYDGMALEGELGFGFAVTGRAIVAFPLT